MPRFRAHSPAFLRPPYKWSATGTLSQPKPLRTVHRPTQCVSVANPVASTQPLDSPSSRRGRLATIDPGVGTCERDSTSQPAMGGSTQNATGHFSAARLQFLLTSAVHFWSRCDPVAIAFRPQIHDGIADSDGPPTSLGLVLLSCSWIRSAIRGCPMRLGVVL
jgi:hypothetical protein